MRIALLEDDPDAARVMRHWLESDGHSCAHYGNGAALLREIGRESFDLYLLDWNVPDHSGIEVLARMRMAPEATAPVILVTARDAEEDIVAGLEAGADDYLVKPIRRGELLARIGAILRRTTRPGTALSFGPYRFDLSSQTASVDDTDAQLTGREFDLAVFLFRNAGRLLSRAHIEEAVWGRVTPIESRTLDTHVSRLRRKLGLNAARGWRLASVYNFGYRLEQVEPGV